MHPRFALRSAGRSLTVLLAASLFTLILASSSQASGVTVTDLNNGDHLCGTRRSPRRRRRLDLERHRHRCSPARPAHSPAAASSVGFESGIVLSSGKVQSYPEDEACSRGVEGPNTCYEATGGKPAGPERLGQRDRLRNAGRHRTHDPLGLPDVRRRRSLEFDFVPQHATAQFSYVFSSEEYSDYANTPYNDVFGFFINGTNCALVPGTTEPVSVNTINNGNDQEGGDTTPHHPETLPRQRQAHADDRLADGRPDEHAHVHRVRHARADEPHEAGDRRRERRDLRLGGLHPAPTASSAAPRSAPR